MARRGRLSKIQTEQVNPSTALDSVTETPLKSKDINLIGITSDEENTRTAEVTLAVVRRSKRLVNTPIQANSVEHVVEDIVIVEGEKEEGLSPNEENQFHEESRVMQQPATQPHSHGERTNMTNLNYRSMYITSQKKVGKLIKKNRQLRKSLEYANGQIKAYAEMTPIVSSLSKANELLCNRQWSSKRLRT